jgi:hypothetical protein
LLPEQERFYAIKRELNEANIVAEEDTFNAINT